MPVERIENLPAGIRLFLDANIFVYAFLGHSNQCRELLGRCATEQVLGITTLDVVNEVTHRMMLAEALGSGLIKRDRVRDLRGKWQMARNRSIDRVLDANVGHLWFERARADDGRSSAATRSNYPSAARASHQRLPDCRGYGRVWDSQSGNTRQRF